MGRARPARVFFDFNRTKAESAGSRPGIRPLLVQMLVFLIIGEVWV